MQQFTKQAIAQELKSQMKTKLLDKITVKELVEACGINRQTFYYHFQDIYDLLGWIYKTEALGAIQDSKSYGDWQQGLVRILDYVQSNRELCINTYRSLAREHLESFLQAVLCDLLGDVVDELSEGLSLEMEHRDFITRFYSYAFMGVLIEWIKSGMRTSHTQIVENLVRIMDGNFGEAIRRFLSPG